MDAPQPLRPSGNASFSSFGTRASTTRLVAKGLRESDNESAGDPDDQQDAIDPVVMEQERVERLLDHMER